MLQSLRFLFDTNVIITPGFIIAQCISAFLLCSMILASKNQLNGNIIDTFSFYGAYHQHPINKLIHFFGVPGIQWSAIIMVAHLPLPIVSKVYRNISWALPVVLFYVSFYIFIDMFGGLLYTPIICGMYVTATKWTKQDQVDYRKKTSDTKSMNWIGTGKVLKLALYIHIFSWYVQIHPGHAIYEGSKPALLESLGGSLTSAPLFAFYEGLWHIGINTELQKQTEVAVFEYTRKLCEGGKTRMRVCDDVLNLDLHLN